jgi:DNA invertase Pin-like site-specific DNA recombinase
MNRIFAYSRVSHIDQVNHGYSLDAQRITVTAEGNQLIGQRADLSWYPQSYGVYIQPGLVVDPAVSAYRVDFRDRPGGRWIFDRLQKGDVIIVARLDRTFRRTRDFLNTAHRLDEMGVELRLCRPRLNNSTPAGRAMLQSYMVWAEWDSAIKSQRIREAIALKKRMGAKATREIVTRSPRFSMAGSQAIATSPASEVTDKPTVSVQPRWLRDKYLCPAAEETNAAGRVFGYLRNSHIVAADGLGVDSQREQIMAKADKLLTAYPMLTMGDVVYDRSVSAFRRAFATRPAGSVLAAALREGDHVIFARHDRAFRNVVDCLTTVRAWLAKGVQVHFLDLPDVDLNDPAGQAMMAQSALFCEMESSLQSARRMEGIVARVAMGGFPGVAPHGYSVRKLRRDNTTVVQWDMQYLRMARWARWLEHRFGSRDYPRMVRTIEAVLAKREGRTPIKELGQMQGRGKGMIYPKWSYWKVRRLCLTGGERLAAYEQWKRELIAKHLESTNASRSPASN